MRSLAMKLRPVAIGITAALFFNGPAPRLIADDPTAPPGVEVQNRGAVHEAFASAVAFNPVAGPVVPKEPPKAIEETLPDEKPEGHVVWISGYFSWDDARKDFLWISGVWREPPPQRVWVPGYWNNVPGGFQWVSGYWQQETQQAIEYLPAPPPVPENGPTSPQISPNYFWVPGHWVWKFNHYVWSPGYWTLYQTDWVWIPAHYQWTPGGFVFIPGHWDYPLALRGVCFAPVRFVPSVWVYSPWQPVVMLNLGCMSTHLFCGPYYGHYYFGDYYDDVYLTMGYQPWFQYASIHVGPGCIGYDPLFAYYSVYTHHIDPHWAMNMHMVYNTCKLNKTVRPPLLYSPMMKSIADPHFQQVASVTRVNNLLINRVKVDAGMLDAARKSTTVLNMGNNIKVGMTFQTARKFETLNPALKTQFKSQTLQHAEVMKGRISLEKSAMNLQPAGGSKVKSFTLPTTMQQALVTTRPLTLPKLNPSGAVSTTTGAGTITKSTGRLGPTGSVGGTGTGVGSTGASGGTGTIRTFEPPPKGLVQPSGLKKFDPPMPPGTPKKIEGRKVGT